jgi:hypothetical protein
MLGEAEKNNAVDAELQTFLASLASWSTEILKTPGMEITSSRIPLPGITKSG